MNLRSRSLYAIARPSVCRLYVMLVSPSQGLKLSAIFLCHLERWPPVDFHEKFYRNRPRGTRLLQDLNARGVAKYSDFGPISRKRYKIVSKLVLITNRKSQMSFRLVP